MSITVSLFLTYQQIRQLEEEKAHLQQRADKAQQRADREQQTVREMIEESQGFHSRSVYIITILMNLVIFNPYIIRL